MIADEAFIALLTHAQKKAWKCIIEVIQKFLGNERAENYVDIVKNMIVAIKEIGVNMSLKIHFLNDHLNCFPNNLGNFKNERSSITETTKLSHQKSFYRRLQRRTWRAFSQRHSCH